MDIEVLELDGGAVVSPGDELDLLGYQPFAEKLVQLLEKGNKRIIIDLGRVTYVNSSAVRALLALSEKAGLAGGAILLAGVSGGARASLDAGGVLKAIPVYDTVDEAMPALTEK